MGGGRGQGVEYTPNPGHCVGALIWILFAGIDCVCQHAAARRELGIDDKHSDAGEVCGYLWVWFVVGKGGGEGVSVLLMPAQPPCRHVCVCCPVPSPNDHGVDDKHAVPA